MKHKKEFEAYKDKIRTIGARVEISEEEFDDLLPLMIESDSPVVTEAFEQMLLVGKMIFGAELGELAAERERERMAIIKEAEAKKERKEFRRQRREQIDLISEKIKERRLDFLGRLMMQRTAYSSVKGKEKMDVDQLIASGHLKKTLFKNLKVKSTDEIPTSNIVKARIRYYAIRPGWN